MLFFQNAYMGTPTWDVGRPQAAIVRLAEAGAFEGDVLDVGCGTGENALFVVSRGLAVVGVDFAEAAIERARAKAADRGYGPAGDGAGAGAAGAPSVEFLVRDALDLASLGRMFDCALDSGLFHCLQPDDRRRYAESLRAVLRPNGRLFLLAWSDRNPFGRGPERISRDDIRRTFRGGWEVEAIEPDTLDTNLPEGLIHAWLARIRRRG